MNIPLIKPYIDEDIKKRVLQVLDSGYWTEGGVTAELERVFAEYIGVRHAVAVSSCTTGLEIALRALGIGPGHEVIVPDYTYPATASVVAIVGAQGVIVDVDPSNMLIDYDAVEEAVTPRTKAVIPVSLFGNPLDYDRLNEIKRKHGLWIIEDAAGAIGAEFKGRKMGAFADISVFSLHPRKFITTGEGGMITTDNEEWAAWMKSYKHFGMAAHSGDRSGIVFERVGTNYKLSDILSAVGLGQMLKIEALLERRQALAGIYNELLGDIAGVTFPETHPEGRASYQSYCIKISHRDRIMASLRSQGIEVQIGTYSLHQHPAFLDERVFSIRGDMKGSSEAFFQCLTLPLYHTLRREDQELIVDCLRRVL